MGRICGRPAWAFELYRVFFCPGQGESWVQVKKLPIITLYQKLVVYMAEELIRNKEYAQVEENLPEGHRH